MAAAVVTAEAVEKSRTAEVLQACHSGLQDRSSTLSTSRLVIRNARNHRCFTAAMEIIEKGELLSSRSFISLLRGRRDMTKLVQKYKAWF